MEQHRRAFLRGLATLPLIGGAVELIGNPRAVAVGVTDQLMFEYTQWLEWERIAAQRMLNGGWSGWCDRETENREFHAAFSVAQHLFAERDAEGNCTRYAPRETYEGANAGLRSNAYRWHKYAPPASTRAALILATVGVDWKGPYQ